MDLPIRVIEEHRDPAEVIAAIAAMVEAVTQTKVQAAAKLLILQQLGELQRIQAQTQADCAKQLVANYQGAVHRRYDARLLKRILTLSLSASGDWKRASSDVAQDVRLLLDRIQDSHRQALSDALQARLPLLEVAAGTEQDARGLILALLQAFAPEELHRLINSAGQHRDTT